MTDRLKGLTVLFSRDIREDDAEAIIDAIKMIRGVMDVQPVKAMGKDDMIAFRTKDEIRKKLYDFITNELD